MILRRALVASAALLASAVAATAGAQSTVTCGGTMPGVGGTMFTATPIYITGSSALEPLIKNVGVKLAAPTNTTPYVLIYNKDGGSCAGVNRIKGDGNIPVGTTMIYVPPDATSAKPTLNCNISATTPQLGDLVLSDVDATLCPGVTAQPTGTFDTHGPVNDMVFITPMQSMSTGISAEQAYLVFGLGDKGMVTPWIDPTMYFIRTNDSGTRAMINAAIGLGTHAWLGQDGTANGGKAFGSGDVYNKVAGNAMTAPDATIGILGEDFLDTGTNRSSVKALAFRAFKQLHAFWPDSTVTATDRKNVREGRYAIWGYVHMIASGANGKATSAQADYFINLIKGTLPTDPGFDITDLIASTHLTPTCAMKVTHDIEGGAQKPYSDPAPCGCWFDNKMGSPAAASCTACTSDATCGSGKCRRGFCEAN